MSRDQSLTVAFGVLGTLALGLLVVRLAEQPLVIQLEVLILAGIVVLLLFNLTSRGR